MPAENMIITAKWRDIAVPTGEIKIAENGWKSFFNTITFGLFFKDTQMVTVTAADNSGEAVKIEYLLAKLEKSKKSTQAIYVEVNNLSAVNAVLKNLQTVLTPEFTYQITPPKSGQPGHLGLSLQLSQKFTAVLETLCRIEHLVFAVFE